MKTSSAKSPGSSARSRSDPAARLRATLDAWLARPDWTTNELVRFLEGYDLPSAGTDEEAFLLLLRGLPRDESNGRALLDEMARRLATLLEERPDQHPRGRLPEQMLYNLFFLASGLARPRELAQPLYAVFEGRLLQGEWQGMDLRSALTIALIPNQIDSRLEAEWEALLEDRKAKYLLGSPDDGFDGMIRMPESPETLGQPDFDAVGKALLTMAAMLESEHTRRPVFRELLGSIKKTYPDHPSWDEDFVRVADRFGFPGWAVECLPRLFIQLSADLEESGEDQCLCFAWHFLLACIGEPGDAWHERRQLCDGHVIEAEVNTEYMAALKRIAPVFEGVRLSLSYPSNRAMAGAAVDAMAAIERAASLRGAHEFASRARSARKKILAKYRLPHLSHDPDQIANALKKTTDTLDRDSTRKQVFSERLLLAGACLATGPEAELDAEMKRLLDQIIPFLGTAKLYPHQAADRAHPA